MDRNPQSKLPSTSQDQMVETVYSRRPGLGARSATPPRSGQSEILYVVVPRGIITSSWASAKFINESGSYAIWHMKYGVWHMTSGRRQKRPTMISVETHSATCVPATLNLVAGLHSAAIIHSSRPQYHREQPKPVTARAFRARGIITRVENDSEKST